MISYQTEACTYIAFPTRLDYLQLYKQRNRFFYYEKVNNNQFQPIKWNDKTDDLVNRCCYHHKTDSLDFGSIILKIKVQNSILFRKFCLTCFLTTNNYSYIHIYFTALSQTFMYPLSHGPPQYFLLPLDICFCHLHYQDRFHPNTKFNIFFIKNYNNNPAWWNSS